VGGSFPPVSLPFYWFSFWSCDIAPLYLFSNPRSFLPPTSTTTIKSNHTSSGYVHPSCSTGLSTDASNPFWSTTALTVVAQVECDTARFETGIDAQKGKGLPKPVAFHKLWVNRVQRAPPRLISATTASLATLSRVSSRSVATQVVDPIESKGLKPGFSHLIGFKA
jgi:hypothetical protein